MQSVCLAMIVRDSGETIERCIDSILQLPQVDRWRIIDTGSQDDTIPKVLGKLGHLPGSITQSEWVSHRHNRTELLNEATHSKTGADYVIMPDSDMQLQVLAPVGDFNEDAMKITIKDRGLEYPLPLLTNARHPFQYYAPAHVYLGSEEPFTEGWARELAFIDHGGGGHRPGKIEEDAKLFAMEVANNPEDRRSWFYLGQSHRDLGNIDAAIQCYKIRAFMGGWDEEVYWSKFQAGVMLCENVNAREGMKLLLEAYLERPHRVEALRALSSVAHNVADKAPIPTNDVLFVQPALYKQPEFAQLPATTISATATQPEFNMPSLIPKESAQRIPVRSSIGRIKSTEVSAIIVTRGDKDLTPIIQSLPYKDIIICDNSHNDPDLKVFGRYASIPLAANPVIYWQDDDIIFRDHEKLLAEYEPNKVVCNMDTPWASIYPDWFGMMGAGSLCDADLPHILFKQYLYTLPFDEDMLLECDFAFGSIAPIKRVDLGFEVRDFADDADRLYKQPGQTERKYAMIERARALKLQIDEMA